MGEAKKGSLSPVTEAKVAVTEAEDAADHAKLQVDIAAGHGREDVLAKLSTIRGRITTLGSVIDSYRDEHGTLLDEIDALRDELAAERLWHSDVQEMADDEAEADADA